MAGPLENEVLQNLHNREVIASILNQTVKYSKILPFIETIDIDGDTGKVVSIKSREPKKYSLNYNPHDFGPNEVLVYKTTIEEEDKLIFDTTFSEPIEKLAVGEGKLSTAIAKQTHQVSYDAAVYLDKDLIVNHVSNLDNYGFVQEMSAEELRDVQRVGEVLLTTLFDMTSPSGHFTKSGDEANISETDKALCFVDSSLYARMRVASMYKSPSPVLDELRKECPVIPVNMVGKVKAAIFDSDGVKLLRALTQRELEYDKYTLLHKILDHMWRKWMVVPFRCSFAIVQKETEDEEEDEEYAEEYTTNSFSLNKSSENSQKSKGVSKESSNLQEKYLEELGKEIGNYVKSGKGEIKTNSSQFWSKVNSEIQSFNKEEVKTNLGNIFNKLYNELDSGDSNQVSRYGAIEGILKTKKLINS